MWKMLRASRGEAELHKAMVDLVQETLRGLIYITGGAYLALQLLIGMLGHEQMSMAIWFLMPILALSSGLALHLLPRRILLAQTVWHTGLLLLITAALVVFRHPEIAFLYTLLPFVAVVTAGGVAGLIAEGIIAGLCLLLALAWPSGLFPLRYVLPVLAGGVLTGLVGWGASRTLYLVTGWSLEGFGEARRHLEEARQHRAQLAQVFKDLDQAYYRLERTNAALVAAWRAAAEAERFKAEFAASLSHELRTPLNLIIGFAEMMLTAPHKYEGIEIPRPYRSDLDTIYQNARHLEALVNDVLDLARIDAGQLTLTHEEVDIAALVDEVVGMVRDYVVAKGLELHVRLAPGLPALYIDRLRIRQVLLNLLVNAARFTEAGRIRVEAAREGAGVTLRVTDTGRGIAEHELPHIFAEFHQATAASPAVGWAGGTGLGLPISKKLVERHGGQMGVESVWLKGTTFWLTLPGVPENEVAADGALAPQVPSLVRPRPLARLRKEKRLLVVVHQDPRVASLLQHHLDDYRLLTAPTLAEGQALAQEARAIGLISEAGLAPAVRAPEGELGCASAAENALAAEQSLITIQCPLPASREAARLLGAADLLVKPILPGDLWQAIDGLERPIRRVLVADDEPDMVRLIQRTLAPRIAPQDCQEAYNGEEALAALRARPPDLVLLDLMMPRLTGQEVLAQMAQDPALAAIPVIIISAKDQKEVELRLDAPLVIHKSGGLRLEELARLLEADLNILAPGWH